MEALDQLVSRETFQIVRCDSCQFLFTNPRPIENLAGEFYKSAEYISHSDSSRGMVNKLYRIARSFTLRNKVSMVRRVCPHARRVLDYGCGTGDFLAEARRSGMEVEGMEPDATAKANALKKHGLHLHDPNQLLEWNKGGFDIITLWHVLEHVHSLSKTIGRLRELLNPGGRLVVALPNASSFDCRHYGKDWAAWDVPRHLYHFTPATFSEYLTKQGMYIKQAVRMPLDVFYIALLSEKYRRNALWLPMAFVIGCCGLFASIFNKSKTSSLVYIVAKTGENE